MISSLFFLLLLFMLCYVSRTIEEKALTTAKLPGLPWLLIWQESIQGNPL